MGILDSFFRKDVQAKAQQIVQQQYNVDINQLLLASALPSINADGYDYIRLQKEIGAVYEATDIIMKKIINCPIVIYKVIDKAKLEKSKQLEKSNPIVSERLKMQSIKEVDSPEIKRLLANPNPYMNQTQFIWTVGLTYLLQGNAYIYANKVGGKPKELFPISNMNILVDPENQFDPVLGYRMMYGTKVMESFGKDMVYHMKTANPANIDLTWDYLYGVSPLRPYLETMRTIKEANLQNSKQARNGGILGLLSPKHKEDAFSVDQKKDLTDRIKQALGSSDKNARIMASAIALEWQQIGLTSADLGLVDLGKEKNKEIYRAFHVPEQYLSSERSSYNNVSTAVKQLIYDAVAPNADSLSEMLTNFVGKFYDDVIVKLDYNQLPEMAVNMGELVKYLEPAVNAGIINRDEAREALGYGATGLEHMTSYGDVNGQDLSE